MVGPTPASEFRRTDWDWTGRTRPVVEVLLGQLATERDPLERQGIVDRLTRYVRSFAENQVDFGALNAALVKEGFEPLAHRPVSGPRRPLSQMHPENRAALDRADRFYGYEIPQAAAFASEASKSRLAQLEQLVRRTAGDQLSEEELQSAMSMLSMAKLG